MDVVNDIHSPLHGTVPVPRVLQNQLDHLLEMQIADIESELFLRLQKTMRLRKRADWVSIFLAVILILHVIERDIWRLLYWLRHHEEVRFMDTLEIFTDGFQAYKWRHPSRPITLVEKGVYFTNVLLAHFDIAGQGLIPLQLDWNQASTVARVDNNLEVAESIKRLQLQLPLLSELTSSRLLFLTELIDSPKFIPWSKRTGEV